MKSKFVKVLTQNPNQYGPQPGASSIYEVPDPLPLWAERFLVNHRGGGHGLPYSSPSSIFEAAQPSPIATARAMAACANNLRYPDAILEEFLPSKLECADPECACNHQAAAAEWREAMHGCYIPRADLFGTGYVYNSAPFRAAWMVAHQQ
jgi:hypothetical protein